MNTRVKIFSYGAIDTFGNMEEDINEWLSSNPKTKIVETKLTTQDCSRAKIHTHELTDDNGLYHYLNCTVMIIYTSTE